MKKLEDSLVKVRHLKQDLTNIKSLLEERLKTTSEEETK